MIRSFLITMLFFSFLTGEISFVYAQYSASHGQTKIIQGEIVDVDWVGRKVVVKWYDDIQDVWDELTFQVSEDIKITKGTETIGLMDLEQADKIKISYEDVGFSGLKAKEIMVEI